MLIKNAPKLIEFFAAFLGLSFFLHFLHQALYNDHSFFYLSYFRAAIFGISASITLKNALKKTTQYHLSLGSLFGLVFSYGSLFVINFERVSDLGRLAFISALYLVIFSNLILIFALIQTKFSFSVLPSNTNAIWEQGPYKQLRHPIYFSYLTFASLVLSAFPNIKNLSFFIMLSIGLYLRSIAEEENLSKSSAAEAYSNYQKRIKYTLISPILFLMVAPPLLLVLWDSDLFNPRTTNINVHAGYPFVTLNPEKYDDWSSTFIANHVLVPLIPSLSTKGPVVSDKYSGKCIKHDRRSGQCKRLKLDFNLNKLIGCNGSPLEKVTIENELFSILKQKNWLLSGITKCPRDDQGICFEIDYVNDWELRLKNLYFRFGFSQWVSFNQPFGFGTHCVTSDPNKKEKLILSSRNKTLYPNIIFDRFSNVSTEIDISLYNDLDIKYIVPKETYAPLAYYLVVNPKKDHSRVWLDDEIATKVTTMLVNNKIIDNITLPSWLPQGFRSKTHEQSTTTTTLLLPIYFNGCEKMADDLMVHLGGGYKVKCINTVEHIMALSSAQKTIEWDAFLSPLTPGAYSNNSLQEQYFNSISKDTWVKMKPEGNYFRLIGGVTTKIGVNEKKVCGVNSTPLGVGDITVSDFILCK